MLISISPQTSHFHKVSFWIFSTFVLTICFLDHDVHSRRKYFMVIEFMRLLWPILVSWIIIACIQNFGGVFDEILSWKFWKILSKISLSFYLVHVLIVIGIAIEVHSAGGNELFNVVSVKMIEFIY